MTPDGVTTTRGRTLVRDHAWVLGVWAAMAAWSTVLVLVALLCGFHPSTVLLGAGVSTIVALILSKRGIGMFIPLFYGSSFIADTRGDKIAELGRTEEGVIVAPLDFEANRRKRAAWACPW